MSRVLVLADSLSQADDIQRHISGQRDSDTKFIYPAGITQERAKFDALIHDCREVIKDEDVDTVICLHPQNYIIQAVLLKDFPQMRGPSFESVMLCLHKYYNKKLLLNGFNLSFEALEVEDATQEDYAMALDETGEQSILIDAFKASTSLAQQVTSDKLSFKDIENIRGIVTKNHDNWKALLSNHTNLFKHPKLSEPLCLMTEQWKAYDGDVTFHQVECCVCDGELVPWIITDIILSPIGKRRCLKYISIPSALKETSQHEIWGTVGMIAQRLISYDFDNQFFHLLVMCTDDGAIRVVDLDCGIIPQNTPLYKHVLNQGDNLKACVQLGRGRIVREPKINPQRHSIRAELRTFSESAENVDQVIDIRAARQIHEVELLVHQLDAPIKRDPVDGGMHVANVYINGRDLEQCLQDTRAKLGEFVRPKGRMNWKRDKPRKEEVTGETEQRSTPS